MPWARRAKAQQQFSKTPSMTTERRRVRRRQPRVVPQHSSFLLSLCVISSLISTTTSFVSQNHQLSHHAAAHRTQQGFIGQAPITQYALRPRAMKNLYLDDDESSHLDESPTSAHSRPQHTAATNRRDFVVTSAQSAAAIATGLSLYRPDAALADPFTQRTGEQLYVLPGRRNRNSTTFLDISGLGDGRSVEECLLKLLPVQNRAYKSLQRQLVDAVAGCCAIHSPLTLSDVIPTVG